MDGSKFDQLIKQLGTTRLTRLTALRGLAVGALAATIGLAEPDDAEARKKCGQCRKKKRKKTKSGKVRIRCKPKANGTLCSLAGVASATCQQGSCVAGLAPVTTTTTTTVPVGQPCTAGQIASNGQVCVGGNFVDCTNFSQCAANSQACLDGRCRGFEDCNANDDCYQLANSDDNSLECNLNQNNEVPDDICIFDQFYEGRCNATNDCGGSPEICILGECLVNCTSGQSVCDAFYGAYPTSGDYQCQFGLCIYNPVP